MFFLPFHIETTGVNMLNKVLKLLDELCSDLLGKKSETCATFSAQKMYIFFIMSGTVTLRSVNKHFSGELQIALRNSTDFNKLHQIANIAQNF